MSGKRNVIKEKSMSDRIFNAAVLILSIVVFIIIVYPLSLLHLSAIQIW